MLLGDAVYLEGGEGGAAIWQHLVAEVEGRKLGTLGTMEGKETVLLGPMVQCQPILVTEILYKISRHPYGALTGRG